MTDFALPLPPVPSVAIKESQQRFPVRRIFCVGRNYAAHIREMGNDERDPPFFFTKPADAVVDSGSVIAYPLATEILHYEIELVVAIGKGGINIGRDAAADHIWGYGAGIDLTRRDLQDVAKKAGRPWDWAKAFDQSAPCGPLIRAQRVNYPRSGSISLSVNGETRQQGDLTEMIWPVPDIVAICSQAVELQPGDLIFTGTPSGVGAVVAGDRLSGEIENIGSIELEIGSRR